MTPHRFLDLPTISLRPKHISQPYRLAIRDDSRRTARGLALLLAGVTLSFATTRGANIYWDGPSGGWEVAANWSTSSVAPDPNPAAPPGASDRVFFSVDTTQNPTVNLNGTRSVSGLNFNSATLLSAGNAPNYSLTVGAEGIVVTSSPFSGLVLIGEAGKMVNLILSAPQTWSNDGSLAISGTVTNNGHLLTLSTGTNAGITISGSIGPGAGGITKTGPGRVTMMTAHSYTGVTSILEGTLELPQPAPAGANGTLGRATSAVLLGATSGTANAGLSANSTVGRNILVQAGNTGLISLGGAGSNYTGTITLNKTLNLDASNGGTGVGTVSGFITGIGGITKSGLGTIALTNPNTFTGPVTVNVGNLRISHPGALGTNTSVTLTSSSNNAGTLDLRGSLTFGTGKTLIMQASSTSLGFPRLQSGAGRNIWATPITITGQGTALFHGSTNSELVVASSVTALDAGASTSPEIRMTGSGLVTFEQVITAPARTFAVTGGGSAVLRGSGNSWKATNITSGSIRLEAGADLPVAPLTFGSGFNQNTAGALDLAGTSQSVLDWNANSLYLAPGLFHVLQNSSGTTASTFSVSSPSYRPVPDTEIRAGAGLTIEKKGTGTLDFLSSMPGRANFVIKEGELRISGSGTTVVQGSIAGDVGAKFSPGLIVVRGRFDHAGTTQVGTTPAAIGLTLGAGAAGIIQINDGKMLGVGLGGEQLTADTVTFGTTGASSFAPVLGAPNGIPLLTAANVTVAGTEVLVQPQGGAFSTGTYPLLRSTNGSIGGAGLTSFIMGPTGTYPHMTATLAHDAVDGRIDLLVSAVDSLIWTGAVSGAWATNGANNFRLASDGASTPFWPSDQVLFDDTGTNKTITVATGVTRVQMGNLKFNNSVGNDYLIRGSLNGVGGVKKLGTGTVTLDANLSLVDPSQDKHAFTGSTEVHEGTLIFLGRNTGGGSMVVHGGVLDMRATVAENEISVIGGTLRGAGITGPVTLESGTIAPGGNSPVATLTTGGLKLLGGSMVFDIAGATAADQISVNGLVQFEGNVELSLSFPTYNPSDNVDVFTLVLNDEADPIDRDEFVFSHSGVLLEEGAIFTATGSGGAQYFQLSYTGGSGNDIVIRAIPEPASGTAVLLGMGMVLSMRRRTAAVD